MNEILHLGLHAPPLELDCDQFVGTHLWAVILIVQLILSAKQERNKQQSYASSVSKIAHTQICPNAKS